MLGAGRREDVGDLHVLPDAAVQVKTWARTQLTRACREAADGAVAQARNGGAVFHLGLVPIPRAPKADPAATLRWLAVGYDWPGGLEVWEPVATFGTTVAAITHLRTGYGGRVPLRLRMSRVQVRGRRPMLVAPVQAWLDCYRDATTTSAISPGRQFRCSATYSSESASWADRLVHDVAVAR